MAKPNWKKISAEYIKTDIAMRPLAEKYGVPLNTLKAHATRESWSLRRSDYRERIGTEATKKYGTISGLKPEEKEVDATAKIFLGATLAIDWIVERLGSGDIKDAREVDILIRAMNGAKSITELRMTLEEREQRARIAALEKDTEIKGREPVVVTYANISEEDRT